MSTEIPHSSEFYNLVRRARGALRRHALWIGSTLVVLLAIGWLDFAVAVDLLIPLSTTLRVLFAVGFWSLLMIGTAVLLLWPMLRRLKLEDVALRIERSVGNMHNRLLTVLDLHRAGVAGGHESNPAMLAALLRQTGNKLAVFRVNQLINRMPLVRSLAGLAVLLLWAVLLAVLFHESAPTALARILWPTADLPPVTWLRITAPGDLKAPQGDPLPIVANVMRGEVDALTLHLQQPDGRWVLYPMQREGERGFSYSLSGVMSDYRYKISGGGTWTSEYQIRMVPRPIIDAVATSLRLPAYMRQKEPLPVADDVHRIEAPIDSHVVMEASVSGDAARGEMVLLRRSSSTEETVEDQEHVWFDDDLPADAETDRPWRWSTARAVSGLNSFTFDRTRQPFGFTTRLNPLAVPPAGAFYLMVWLDEADPPGRVSLTLRQDGGLRAFEWGEKSTAAGQPPATHLGPLPQPAGWARLEIPADALGTASAAIKLRGMLLAVDRGQAFFDRPGYLVRKKTQHENIASEAIDTRPMVRDEASGRWSGEVLVASDMLLTLRFFSSLGQASADREPLEVVAVEDQPPTIVIEKPAADVVLPSVQPLPIAARALDDWGLASIGIRVGPAENSLGASRWLIDESELVTSRSLDWALEPEAEHLAPGQTLWYRLVARDCKGQIGETKTYKVSIATPDRASAPETAKPPESLEPLRQLVEQLLKQPDKRPESAEFVASLPEPVRQSLDAQGQFRKPDGTPMAAPEARDLVEKANAQLTPEQKSRLAELIAQLDQRQQELRRLAEMLKQAAQKSAASPLALAPESHLLEQLAAQTQQMAAEVNPATVAQGDPARLERELKAQRSAADHPEQLADLGRQLAELEKARQQLVSDAHLAAKQLDRVAAEVAATAAARELSALAADLETRGRKLQEMGKETGTLASQSPAANEKHLIEISQRQTELDRRALPAIDQLQAILGAKQPEKQPQPLAHWTPPGKAPAAPSTPAAAPSTPAAAPSTPAATPSTPADAGAGKQNPDQGQNAGKDQPGTNAQNPGANPSGQGKNWWDQPFAAPAAGQPQNGQADTGQADTGQADNGQGEPRSAADQAGKSSPAKPTQGKPPTTTPREQLGAHQAAVQAALDQSAGEALQNAATVRELAERLRRSAAGMQPEGMAQAGAQPGGKDQGGKDQGGKDQGGKDQGGKDQGGKEQSGGEQGGDLQGRGEQGGKEQSGNPQPGKTDSGKDQGGKKQGGNDQAGADQSGQGNPPAGAESQPDQPAAAQQQPETDAGRILAEAGTQQALAMAQRLHAQARFQPGTSQPSQLAQEKQPETIGQGGSRITPPTTAGARAGTIAGQARLGSDPRERAHFYQLPPKLRGSLLEGMQERGPEGYQSMIDAYFRELNKEIK